MIGFDKLSVEGYSHDDFWTNLWDRRCARFDTERYGQSFFNALYVTNSVLADRIRGTRLDPFHKDELSEELEHNLRKFLKENWA